MSCLDPCKAMKPNAPRPVRPGLGRHYKYVIRYCMDTLGPSNNSLNETYERSNSNTRVGDGLLYEKMVVCIMSCDY